MIHQHVDELLKNEMQKAREVFFAVGLFSTDGAKQVKKALVEAEKRARDADMSDLLDMADEQLEKVMKGIFEDSIGDRVLVIKRTPRTDPTPGDAEISSDMDNA